MGSVGDNYKCPWCGRVGNGGYAPDWVGYPICTFGEYACLWKEVKGLPEWRAKQLKCILRNHVLIGCGDVLGLVAEFIGPSESDPQVSDKACFLRRPVTLPLASARRSISHRRPLERAFANYKRQRHERRLRQRERCLVAAVFGQPPAAEARHRRQTPTAGGRANPHDVDVQSE
jgi:hypothetical protein